MEGSTELPDMHEMRIFSVSDKQNPVLDINE